MVFSFLKLLSKDRWRVFLFNDNYSNTLSLCVVSRFSYMKYIVRKMFSILFTGVIHVIIKVFLLLNWHLLQLRNVFTHHCLSKILLSTFGHEMKLLACWHAKKFKVVMMLEMTFYWYDCTLCFNFIYYDIPLRNRP